MLSAGHLLYLDIPRPTAAIKVWLNFAGSGIRYVSVLDFLASSRPTQVLRTPSGSPAKSIDVSFDGWVFAKSGVAFVWVLEDDVRSVGDADVSGHEPSAEPSIGCCQGCAAP